MRGALLVAMFCLVACGGPISNEQQSTPAAPIAPAAAVAAVSDHESKAYSVMSSAMWSAFECAALASKLKQSTEGERLFKFGYDQGQKFMKALQAGQIKQEHLRAESPMIVGLLVRDGGPSVDFILGKIWSEAQDSALDDVYKTGERFHEEEEQALIARNKFDTANCQFIGK